MPLTVGNILPSVARFTGGQGVSLESAEGNAAALQLYNEITEELLADDSWDGVIENIEFDICDSCVSLPSQFEAIRACTINDHPAPIRPAGWRYLQQTPGLAWGCGMEQLTDMGDHYATARDLGDDAAPLLIYSDRPEHVNAHAVLQGTGPDGAEILRGNFPGMIPEPGERIQIVCATELPDGGTPASALFTNNLFLRRPSVVTKTITFGSVFLYGYNDPSITWLATYRPGETNPGYRRYRVDIGGCHRPTSLIARVVRRYIEAVHPDERAIIQFRPPFEIYAKAIAARRAGEFDNYQKYRNSALSKLRGQRDQKTIGQTHQLNFGGRGGNRIAFAWRR